MRLCLQMSSIFKLCVFMHPWNSLFLLDFNLDFDCVCKCELIKLKFLFFFLFLFLFFFMSEASLDITNCLLCSLISPSCFAFEEHLHVNQQPLASMLFIMLDSGFSIEFFKLHFLLVLWWWDIQVLFFLEVSHVDVLLIVLFSEWLAFIYLPSIYSKSSPILFMLVFMLICYSIHVLVWIESLIPIITTLKHNH